jgi:hypothetical protein
MSHQCPVLFSIYQMIIPAKVQALSSAPTEQAGFLFFLSGKAEFSLCCLTSLDVLFAAATFSSA